MMSKSEKKRQLQTLWFILELILQLSKANDKNCLFFGIHPQRFLRANVGDLSVSLFHNIYLISK